MYDNSTINLLRLFKYEVMSFSIRRSIYIWKAGGDGRCETMISLPTNPIDSHRHRSKLNSTVGNWITVRWIEPKLLLASSLWGELISWDVSIMKKGKPTCKLIHASHGRGLFCIAHASNLQENMLEDWRIKNRFLLEN